ncbi:MAG: phosphohydrolase [Gammaproteobacteria bacterium]|nr:MAG: phosphohydrolase [Gammaproteobacteria bacterium]
MKTIIKAVFGITLCVIWSATAQAATQYHRLVWDADPAHQATIGFSPQGESKDPYVLYGTDTNEQNWVNAPVTNTYSFQVGLVNHFVRLAGLPANSPVYYRVCDQDGCGQRFWFKTAPTDNSPFVVVAGGDTRAGWSNRKAGNRLIAKIRPLFIMHGGDYTNLNLFIDMGTYLSDWQYTFSSDQIDGKEYKRIYPFVPTHGNHEDNDYATLCKVFGVDFNRDGNCDKFDTYGAFNISPLLRVYTLNSQYKNSGYASYAAAMNEWLLNDLDQNADTTIWRFAQYHKPMFPHYAGKPANTELFDWWAEAFYQYGMNLVVESDTHINKITKALKPEGDDFVATTDGGTVFVGEGSWGSPARSANHPKDWTIDLASIQQFKVIQVTPERIVMGTAQFDDTAETLTRQQRMADTKVLPEGISWWLANHIGAQLKLSKAANQLSIIVNDDNSQDEDKFVSLALTDDVFVAQGRADINFNDSTNDLSVDGFDFNYGEQASLFKFDLMGMSSCIDTDSAVLMLDVKSKSNGEFGIFPAQQPWNEETATWNSAMNIASDPVATFVPYAKGRLEIDLSSTGIIQRWLAEGNYGLVIKTEASKGASFASRESGHGAVLKLAYNELAECDGLTVVEVANQALLKNEFDGVNEEVVLAFSLNSNNDNAQLEQIAVAAQGDLDETQLAAVGLYIDENQDGIAAAGERVASGVYENDNGELVFLLSEPYRLPAGDAHLLVTYRF